MRQLDEEVTIKLPESLVMQMLADLNVYRIQTSKDGHDANARATLRLGGEIARQINDQGGDHDRFGGKDVDEIPVPYEMKHIERKKRRNLTK